MKKFFQYILLIFLLSSTGIILTNQESFRESFAPLARSVSRLINKPCSKPIKYSIGEVDSRFGMEKNELSEVAYQAAGIWDNSINRTLFQYDPNSEFKINLVYDDRQERTQESQKLENKLGTLEESHEAVVDQYNNLNSTYQKRLSDYKKSVANYEKNLQDYNDEVESWNKKGGAPADIYDKLKKEKNDLESQFNALEKERKNLNSLIGKTNDLVAKESSIVNNYNNQLSTYKERYGQASQFDKGVYDGKKIDIFQFNEISDLRLTIAHEFGHALGIDHLNNPDSLMYYLMGEQDMESPHLSNEDISSLKTACAIE